MTSQKLIPFIHDGEKQQHFYVDPVTGILYFKKGHGGRKVKFSCKLKGEDFVKAKRFANQKLSEILGLKQSVVRALIKDEIGAWLKVKESEDLKYDTLNNIRRAAKQIKEFWGDKLPSDITRDNIPLWFEWWKRNYSDIDMENAIKYFRNFCRYLAQKLVNGRPLLAAIPDVSDPNYKKIRRRRKKKKENIFSHKDFNKILSTAASARDRLIILIMYTMATRITETLEMSFESEIVKRNGKWIYQWSDGQNKANLDGWHELHPALIKPIESLYRDPNRETDRLFPQQNDESKAMREQMIDWEGWRERAALDFHWTPHTFRHTCLSNLFNDPNNPQALICKLYRVSLAVAMETYVKPTDEGRARMAKALMLSEKVGGETGATNG